MSQRSSLRIGAIASPGSLKGTRRRMGHTLDKVRVVGERALGVAKFDFAVHGKIAVGSLAELGNCGPWRPQRVCGGTRR